MCGKPPRERYNVDDELADRVFLPIGGRVVGIDACIHRIVAALNSGGVPTAGCCCGHGEYLSDIALVDGRYLLILPDAKTAHYAHKVLKSNGGG